MKLALILLSSKLRFGSIEILLVYLVGKMKYVEEEAKSSIIDRLLIRIRAPTLDCRDSDICEP